eukprot:1157757-Pelagomonas_calceolata.AAC.12
MEEMLGNVAGARQIFERWMRFEPDHMCWMAYIKVLTQFEPDHKPDRKTVLRYSHGLSLIASANWCSTRDLHLLKELYSKRRFIGPLMFANLQDAALASNAV